MYTNEKNRFFNNRNQYAFLRKHKNEVILVVANFTHSEQNVWVNIPEDAFKALDIKDNEAEIEDRFYTNLEFGTGGLRGVMGAGTNRMNIYTVRMATQGIANYLAKIGISEPSAAIAFDNRNNASLYALETALCLCANGVKVYLFDALRPTPELSFAVRHLHCNIGVNITASHNPKEYNGYKVYWDDGAQIVSPQDKEIIAEVNNIEDFSMVKTMDKDAAIDAGLLNVIGQEIDDAYIGELHKLVMNPEEIQKAGDLKIVYSPLHGTGLKPVTRVLSELGFKDVHVVEEQAVQDGNFPTVKSPNPEGAEAYALSLELAKKVGGELILVTDPDADRLGMYGYDSKNNEYKEFTGNMFGAILCDYVLMQRSQSGRLPENPAIVTTVVITNMVKEICKKYDTFCDCNNLIGFKNIASRMRAYEQTGEHNYVFGLEDTFGCLPGTYARDKDSVGTLMLLCEAAAYYKNRGMTLWDRMVELWQEYGYYKEKVQTMKFDGREGAAKIQSMIQTLRDNPVQKVGTYSVEKIYDYKLGTETDAATGKSEAAVLPKSNMIYYQLADGAWFLVRPSGTEPKIKFYLGVKENSQEDAAEQLDGLAANVKAMFS